MFRKWPRLVAEYKPAFGAVFAQYLVNYTHWGYSDLDVVLGQLPRFIERAELMDHHIITYSFGDMEAVYLRGQWTMHQNMPMVNDIWQACKHLGAGLQNELFNKVAWARRMEAMGKKTYHKRFLSAEGCYSYLHLTLTPTPTPPLTLTPPLTPPLTLTLTLTPTLPHVEP